MGIDILCDTYTVQKDDWIYKIFHEKGEISHRNYPEFIKIFKRMNPGIHDANLIRPNQNILIPLKKIAPESFPGQSTGIVIIPFVTILNKSELIAKYSATYKVKTGDNISTIISKEYGQYGTKEYYNGIKLFKIINPGIKNIDLIYSKEIINLPAPSLKKQKWYKSIFRTQDEIKNNNKPAIDNLPLPVSIPISINSPSVHKKKISTYPILSEIASILNAKLITKGIYHFPREEADDLLLDLSTSPVMELENETKILCLINKKINENDKKIIKSFWQNLRIITIPSEKLQKKNIESILNSVIDRENIDINNSIKHSDHGLIVNINADIILNSSNTDQKDYKTCLFFINNHKKKTDVSILHYLALHNIIIKDILRENTDSNIAKSAPGESAPYFDGIKKNTVHIISETDKKKFVKEVLFALGYKFYTDIKVTFPYAGIQIEAISNLISVKNGFPLLVDFGNFYGDTALAVKKTGFEIVAIKKEDDYQSIVQKLLTGLSILCEKNPVFSGATRESSGNISISIPGILITNKDNKKIIITFSPLHEQIIRFLGKKNIQVLNIKN